MESSIERSCLQIIQDLTNQSIHSLNELAKGYTMPVILQKIDPVYFEHISDDHNWFQYKKVIEEFLQQNGIDEEIDIDVPGIHQQYTASIITALFQIFSIVAVFNEEEWKNAVNMASMQEDVQSIVDIVNKIKQKLQDVIQLSKNSRRVSGIKSNKDVMHVLMELEQKEQLYKQMENELWQKSHKINELEHIIENLQLEMKEM